MPIRKYTEDPTRPKPAPVEYAGQWVAWNAEQTEIVAHGREIAQVHAAAKAAGHERPVLQKVPDPHSRYIG